MKLPHLEQWNARRRAIAERYRSSLPAHTIPFVSYEDRISSTHLFVIRIKNREAAQAALQEHGIHTGIHYPKPIHLQPAYAGRWKQGDFPVAEQLSKEILSLPLYPELTDNQIDEVTAAVAALH